MNNPISNCCGARPLGEIFFEGDEWMGICSCCQEHSSFEDSTEEDYE